MAEKLAQLEPRSDGTALIRGRVGAILSQFEWAVLVPEGTVIPLVKTDVAVGSLEAAGWRVDRRRPEMVDKPKPNRDLSNLPECANPDCRQPYRLGKIPQPDERCRHCDQPLSLVQVYERHCPGGQQCHNPRQPCTPGQGRLIDDFRVYDALARVS